MRIYSYELHVIIELINIFPFTLYFIILVVHFVIMWNSFIHLHNEHKNDYMVFMSMFTCAGCFNPPQEKDKHAVYFLHTKSWAPCGCNTMIHLISDYSPVFCVLC